MEVKPDPLRSPMYKKSGDLIIPYLGMTIIMKLVNDFRSPLECPFKLDVYQSGMHFDDITNVTKKAFPAKGGEHIIATADTIYQAITWISRTVQRAENAFEEDIKTKDARKEGFTGHNRSGPKPAPKAGPIYVSSQLREKVKTFETVDSYVKAFSEVFSSMLKTRDVYNALCTQRLSGLQFRDYWKEHGICFGKATLIYLLTYAMPYSKQVRKTTAGFVPVKDWVVQQYNDKSGPIRQILDELPDWDAPQR